MEEIMDFLVENYVYVAAISGFLIIVLLGLIIAGNRKKKKTNEPDMVSISDVNTGSINDVATNLNMQNGVEPLRTNEVPNMQPNNIGEVNQVSEVPPVSNLEPTPFMNKNTMNPINNMQSNINPANYNNVQPAMETVPNFNQGFVSNPVNNAEPVMNNQENSMNQPVYQPVDTNNSVNSVKEPEDIDIIDFSTPIGQNTGNSPVQEPNPLNGNELNFNQNNNQGV